MEKARMKVEYKQRLRILAFLVSATSFVLIGGLFSVQVFQHDMYLREADTQQKLKVEIEADRGRILDRNANALAISRDCFTLNLDRRRVNDIGGAACALANALDRNPRSLERMIRKYPHPNVMIERKLPRRKKELVEELHIQGISFDIEKDRYYPNDALGAQVIGYAGMDNEGLEGIEGFYNEVLSGDNGIAILQRDGRGGTHFNPDFLSIPPRSGQDVVLTLDIRLQEAAEDALDNAIERCGAKSGSVILMDPFRGEILALAAYPRINLNSIPHVGGREALYAAMRNRAVTDLFEPGSTFKIVTLTSVVEKGLASLDERIFCENGKYPVSRHLFHDIHKYEWLTVREIFELSSNIGVIKLAERLEKEGLYQMSRRYGFGSPTGIDFPGEVGGILNRLDGWSGLSLASIAIGQEVCVTPLQMALAFSAIANGGVLMKPLLVKEIWDTNGAPVYQAEPEVIRQVMSQETSDRLKDVLVGVVERGTGTKAGLDGIELAGKTGTAQKNLPGERGYATGKYVTSFGGFVPARKPRYAVFAVLDEPERDKWGGESAAPLVHELIESILSISGIAYVGYRDEPPSSSISNSRIETVHVSCADRESYGEEPAKNVPETPVFDLKLPARSSEEIDRGRYPFVSAVPTRGRMPDLSGLSMRVALLRLAEKGLAARVEGMGRVVEQVPGAGEEYRQETDCVVRGEVF
jgi:cell division protein FtsI/penicillin-binding protein 2